MKRVFSENELFIFSLFLYLLRKTFILSGKFARVINRHIIVNANLSVFEVLCRYRLLILSCFLQAHNTVYFPSIVLPASEKMRFCFQKTLSVLLYSRFYQEIPAMRLKSWYS